MHSSNEIANVHFDGPSSEIDAITSYGRDPLGSYMSERAEGKLKFQPFSRGERDSCFTALYRPRVLPLPPLTAWNGASQITVIPHTKIRGDRNRVTSKLRDIPYHLIDVFTLSNQSLVHISHVKYPSFYKKKKK